MNGTELGRFDATPGSPFYTAADTYRLLASTIVDNDEETKLRKLYFPSAQLLAGSNTLAVSVHNNQPTSSDLGLRLTQLTAGPLPTPVQVTIEVQDSQAIPVIANDLYTVQGTTTPIDSYLIGGSLYKNDGLLGWDGNPYDPILEVETGGSPAGAVTLNRNTGHFTMATPTGFFGTTSFTYRVRDKDGWSLPATAAITILPSRAYDVWRQAQIGGNSLALDGLPGADPDSDSLANLLEFALNRSPVASSPSAPFTLRRTGSGWEVAFDARASFGQDAMLTLESSQSLTGMPWTAIARLNDVYPSVNQLASGVTVSDSLNAPLRQYRLTLPTGSFPSEFFRLRATQERHPLDP